MSGIEREIEGMLTQFERKSHQWEWSDLMNWLNKLFGVLSSYNGNSIPNKFTLAKRISQCLNPNLPQRIHFVALKVLHRIFTISHGDPSLFMEDLSLFTGGLLSFFQFATPDNKASVLTIIEDFFLKADKKVSAVVPGIVRALLPSMDDVGSVELSRRISSAMDGLALDHGAIRVVWHALLATPPVRVGALNYLSKIPLERLKDQLPDKELLVNAFVACLKSENPRVRKDALELLKNSFTIEGDILDDEEKVSILEAMLYISKSPDYNTTRRIWEWCFQGERSPTEDTQAKFLEYAEPALKRIFSIFPKTSQDAVAPLLILETLLDHDELAEPLLEQTAEIILEYVRNLQGDQNIASHATDKCISITTREPGNRRAIWEALDNFLTNSITFRESQKALKVLRFYLDHAGTLHDEDQDHELIHPILYTLLSSIRMVYSDSSSDALSLIKSLVKYLSEEESLSIYDCIQSFHEFFVEMCKGEYEYDSETLKVAISVIFKLQQFNEEESGSLEWVSYLEELTKASLPSISLIAVKGMIKLLANEEGHFNAPSAQILQNPEITRELMDILWEHLSVPEILEKCTLVIDKLYTYDSKIVGEKIQKELSSEELSKGIMHFHALWVSIGNKNEERLCEMFSGGEGILEMLNLLEHHDASIRHHSRIWAIASLETLPAILDPLLVSLYHGMRDIENSQIVLNRLRRLIRAVPHLIFSKANREPSSYLKEEIETELNSYLRILVDAPLWFIRSRSAVSVQADACELLCLVLSEQNHKLAFQASNDVIRAVLMSMHSSDMVKQMQLMSVLDVIFFNSNLEKDRVLLKKLLNSEEFEELYKNCIFTEDSYACKQWINFVTQTFPLLISFFSTKKLPRLMEELIVNFCSFRRTKHKDLFIGLSHLIHGVLNLRDIENDSDLKQHILEINRSDAPERSSQESGLLREVITFFAGEESIESAKPFKKTLKSVFSKIPLIIKTGLGVISDNPEDVDLRISGIFRDIVKMDKITWKEVLNLLLPIARTCPDHFVKGSIKLWTGDEEINRSGIVRLFLSMNISPAVYLCEISNYLFMDLKIDSSKNTRSKELSVAHFSYSIFAYFKHDIQKEEEERDCWIYVMNILQALEYSKMKEVAIWRTELLNLFISILPTKNVSKDKRMMKDIQRIAEKLIGKLCDLVLGPSELLGGILPPCAYKEYGNESISIDKASILCIEHCVLKIVDAFWRESNILNKMTERLVRAMMSMRNVMPLEKAIFISSFLSRFFKEPVGRRLVSVCKKDVMNFITNPRFFSHLQKDQTYLVHWSEIFSAVSIKFSEVQIVSDIMGRVQSGFFVSKKTEKTQKARLLKCVSFLIFSREKDSFRTALTMICDTLKELMWFSKKLIPAVFMCFRVIIYKTKPQTLNNIWPGLWPHVLAKIVKILNSKKPYLPCILAAFKLLQFLVLSNNEEFHLHRWVFFHSLDSKDYRPLLHRIRSLGEYSLDSSGDCLIRETEIKEIDEARKTAQKLVNSVDFMRDEAGVSVSKILEELIMEDFLAN